jgi:hypothetical protein
MKFLKQKNISRYTINDNTLITNQYGRAVMDLTGALRLPKGTTAQRPQLSNVRTPNGPNGYIRYNTETQSVEAYVDGIWEVIRSAGDTAIVKQTLGPGNDIEDTFGPLIITPTAPNPTGPGPNAEYVYPIIVLVENVMQIQTTNYELIENYLGSGNTYIEFTSPVPTDKLITIFYGYGN